MVRNARIKQLGERVGAPFSAWRINPDYTVKGVTLYACNDKNRSIGAQHTQAYTARGTWVCTNTQAGEYYTDQLKALEIAHSRAIRDSREAHEAYIKASDRAHKASHALRAYTLARGEQ
jgi:hypothetical protein